MKDIQIVRRIQRLVDDARQARLRHEKDWEKNIEYVKGKFPRTSDSEGSDNITVNMFWATMRVIVPAVYFKNPELLAIPMRPQDEALAPVVEAATQFWIDRIGTKRLVQKAIVDANVCPWAIAKVGYVTVDEEVTVKIHRKSGDIVVHDESEHVDLTEFAIEQQVLPIGKRPILAKVSPSAFLFDPNSSGPEEAEWCAEEIDRRLVAVLADKKYVGTEKLTASPSKGTLSTTDKHDPEEAEDEFDPAILPYDDSERSVSEFVRLIEFWDKSGVIREDGEPRLYVIADRQLVLLRDDPWPYKMAGYPYFFLRLGVDITDTPIPPAPFSQWRIQQDELNSIRTFGQDWIRRAVTKYLVDESRLSKTTREQLERGEALSILLCSGDPEGMVVPLPGAPLNQEVHVAEEKIKKDIQEISGIADYQRAAWSPSGTTATEQKLVSSAVVAQIDWQRDQVADFVTAIASAVKSLMQQFADKTEIIRLTGRSNFQWKSFTAADIQGEFDITIRAGTQLAPDKSIKYKRALDMFNLLAPVALQTGRVDFDNLLLVTCRELDVDGDNLLVVKDSNEPPQDARDEEVLMRTGGMPHVGQNDNHQEHVRIHSMGIAAAQDEQDQWRHQLHIKAHTDAVMQQQLGQMMQQQQAMASLLGVQPQPSLQGGQGRAAPQPGYPAAPRQFSQKPDDLTQQSRVDARRE